MPAARQLTRGDQFFKLWAACAAGLLTPQALDRLLNEALRRREAANSLLSIADHVAAAGVEPMSMPEITAEVKAARAERGQPN